MSSQAEDPFVTPKPQTRYSNLDSAPLLQVQSSPAQLKRALEAYLVEVNRRIDNAAALGQTLLEQQREIEERIKDVDEATEQIDPTLKKKLADLEREYNEVGRESAKLTNKMMAAPVGNNGANSSSFGQGNLSGSPSTLQSQSTNSPSKLSVPSSRRSRNVPSRQHDLDFAAEIGQSLLLEVRRLQALVSEREESIKNLQIEKSKLEQDGEQLEGRIRSLDDSDQRYKEENWNLGVEIQELYAQQAQQREIEAKLHSQISQMNDEKNMIIKELDELKQQYAKLSEESEMEHKHFETELSAMRRNLATNENERSSLSKKVEELRQELDETQKASIRLRQSLENRLDSEDRNKDTLVIPEADVTPEHSPPPSPTKPTPRHNMLETETLKSSLQHAHRVIANLKSGMNREKTEKAELKRLLQEARDELETVRSGLNHPPGSSGGGGPGGVRRRRDTINFRKPVQSSKALLGVARRSKDEIHIIDPGHDDEWEEAPEGPIYRAQYEVRDTYISTLAATAPEDIFEDALERRGSTASDAFETANEPDTADDFETAHEPDTTETEAYRTGNESPVYDDPTSMDDLTETEGRNRQLLRPKASTLSAIGSARSRRSRSGGSSRTARDRSGQPVRLGKIRNRDSISITSSDDDEEDYRRYRYGSPEIDIGESNTMNTFEEDPNSPIAINNNHRLKLRINKARSKGSRVSSGHSAFDNRPVSAGSSQGDDEMAEDSPASPMTPRKAGSQRLSLFAELGETPMLEEDLEEEDSEEDMPGTPTKKNFIPRVEMVDCGVMTEVPYPEIQEPYILGTSSYLGVEDLERPATAVTVKEIPLMVDSGMQAEAELEPVVIKVPSMVDFGMQVESELEPVVPSMVDSSMQVESEPEPVVVKVEMMDVGTQSLEEPKISYSEATTQSDAIVVPVMVEMGTQFDPELEKIEEIAAPVLVPEFLPEPEFEVVPVPYTETMDMETQSEPGVEVEKAQEKENTVEKIVEMIVGMVQTMPESVVAPVPVVAAPRDDDEVLTAVEEVEKEDEVPAPIIATKDSETQFDPEIEMVVKDTVPVSVGSTQTEPEEEEEATVIPSTFSSAQTVAEKPDVSFVFGSTQTVPDEVTEEVLTVAKETEDSRPEVPLAFSTISSQFTVPIEAIPPKPATPAVVVPVPSADISPSSDGATPKKVSETIEDGQQRPTTPTPASAEKPRFFGSMFGAWKKRNMSPEREVPNAGEKASAKEISNAFSKTGERLVTPPVLVCNHAIQTDISHDFFDNIAKNAGKGKKPVIIASSSDNGSIVERTSVKTPSLRSRASQDSVTRSRLRGEHAPAATKRPGSSSSMREYRATHPPLPSDHKEHIAAAQQKSEARSMGPPPVPSGNIHNVTFRPLTPVQSASTKETDERSVRGDTTPRPRFSATRSEVSSPTSRRSSLSSFASELDNRFNITAEGSQVGENQADPRMIQAITQTMIGEYLWKYTRVTGRGTLSQSRHKRFFWVHPYTRTLYWSDRDPTTAGKTELKAKSVAIEAVRVVNDDNPMPPGLHRKSLVIITPGRALKFTASTGQRHETWFNALSYLLLRTGGDLEEGENNTVASDDVSGFNPGSTYGGSSIRGAASLNSYNSRTTRTSSPPRNASSLSARQPGERVHYQGGISKLGSIFKPSTGFSTFSSRASRHNTSIYESENGRDSEEDLRLELERQEREQEGLENVRACCDGKHDVSTLSRKSGHRGTSVRTPRIRLREHNHAQRQESNLS